MSIKGIIFIFNFLETLSFYMLDFPISLFKNALANCMELDSFFSKIIEISAGIATIKPIAVVSNAVHIPPAKIDGSTRLPPNSSSLKESIIPITVPSKPTRGLTCAIISRLGKNL